MAADRQPIHLYHGPRFCREPRPTGQSINFGGRYINLQKLSDVTGCGHAYLSKIFSGERRASVDYLERVAEGLGMTLTDFRIALKDRLDTLESKLFVIPIRRK